MEQLGFQWMDFYDIRRLRIFRKSVEKIQVSLQSDKNKGHFIQRYIYIHDISLTASLNEKCLRQFSMFHRAFFNSIIDKHQHMHIFTRTFKTVLV